MPTGQPTNMPQNNVQLSTTEGAGTRVRAAARPPLPLPLAHSRRCAARLQPFARPTIIAGNASVVSPTVLGRLRRGGEVKEAAAELIIKYNCIAPGSSTVKVVLPFASPDEVDIQVSFMWVVHCADWMTPLTGAVRATSM